MDKTRYGARMPRRFWDIPVLKYGFYVVPQLYRPDQRLDWGYHRMKGTGAVERGDIIAFDCPLGDGVMLCKRVIGLPGDTVELNGSRYLVPQRCACNGTDCDYCRYYLVKTSKGAALVNHHRMMGKAYRLLKIDY
jgi:signal peptidase I